MANSIGPFYVEIDYTSLFGPHKMRIPTLEWVTTFSLGGHGNFATWDALGIDAVAMVEGLVDKLLPFVASDVQFNNWTVFAKPVDPGPSYPQTTNGLTAKVGTNASGAWGKAVMVTNTFRSETFGLAKITLLDAPSDPDFDPVTTPLTRHTNLLAELNAGSNGWSARDNGRISTFLRQTATLNEKLRRAYRMT